MKNKNLLLILLIGMSALLFSFAPSSNLKSYNVIEYYPAESEFDYSTLRVYAKSPHHAILYTPDEYGTTIAVRLGKAPSGSVAGVAFTLPITYK